MSTWLIPEPACQRPADSEHIINKISDYKASKCPPIQNITVLLSMFEYIIMATA